MEIVVGAAILFSLVVFYVIGREDGFEDGYRVGRYEERRRNDKYDFRGFQRD